MSPIDRYFVYGDGRVELGVRAEFDKAGGEEAIEAARRVLRMMVYGDVTLELSYIMGALLEHNVGVAKQKIDELCGRLMGE